jgi:hypothetical protein
MRLFIGEALLVVLRAQVRKTAAPRISASITLLANTITLPAP